MSHHSHGCSHGSCHHGHHHGACKGNACSCSCCQGTCGHSHQEGEHGEQDFAHQLLQLADEAWWEVLKEKIKKNIESEGGKHLDQLAKVVASSNKNRWKNKIGVYKAVEEFREQISNIIGKEK